MVRWCEIEWRGVLGRSTGTGLWRDVTWHGATLLASNFVCASINVHNWYFIYYAWKYRYYNYSHLNKIKPYYKLEATCLNKHAQNNYNYKSETKVAPLASTGAAPTFDVKVPFICLGSCMIRTISTWNRNSWTRKSRAICRQLLIVKWKYKAELNT